MDGETEAVARIDRIDAALTTAGWIVQDHAAMNTRAGTGDVRGVAVREFPLGSGFGFADYILFVNGQAVGVVEAKRPGTSLLDAEVQAEKYSVGFPADLPAPIRPLPFVYQSTGVETAFTNGLDPHPRARPVFHFHTPEGLLANLDAPHAVNINLQSLPPLEASNLWAAQVRAVENVEQSLQQGKPRALIQMATGSGKTFTAITSIYRLIKHAGARRVLFLVDRANLGRQALKEFQAYETPGDGRKFTELYNVHLLQSNTIPASANVVITTIQRLYSMLRDEALDEDAEEESLFEHAPERPVEVSYKPDLPIELFDFVFIDECHRSIYNLWKQVVEYWDASLVGLTATPDKQTFGFFRQNLVMEYNHEMAVTDHVNVDYDVYTIRTKVGTQGSKVEAGYGVTKRDLKTRQQRWEQLDEDLEYQASELDRSVVAEDQIRTVVRTFRDKACTELFPGREHVPKTLVFAKSDAHADDIVRIMREEFGESNQFCEKITYKTSTVRLVEKDADGNDAVTYKSSGIKPEDLLQSFRNSFYPRIAVTVDMIATGTDVKPLEIVMFMRQVKSRNFFEQMKGRGVRIIDDHTLKAVTPDAETKDHFLLIDCCGLLDHEFKDTVPVNREPTVPLKKVLMRVAAGARDTQTLSTLASRFVRLEKHLEEEEVRGLAKLAGQPFSSVAAGLLRACDPDAWREHACDTHQLAPDVEASPEQVEEAREDLAEQAASPIAYKPEFRTALLDMKARSEQVIDEVTRDEVTEVGFDRDAKDRAKNVIASWEAFLSDHRDDITAIQVLFQESHGALPKYKDLKELREQVKVAAPQCMADNVWKAYEALHPDKVKGRGGHIGDFVPLIRFALHKDGELRPYRYQVEDRFNAWIGDQERQGITYTDDQRRWLEAIKDHIAESLAIDAEDFDYAPLNAWGGIGGYQKAFGDKAWTLLEELNGVLVA